MHISDWSSDVCSSDLFGRIDAVVNNAGFLRDAIFHKMSIADWQAIIDVHLNGYFYVSRAAASYFKAQGSGSYVHFTSTSGLIGNVGQANYAAAKLGRSEEHTSELQSLMRISYAVFCLNK